MKKMCIYVSIVFIIAFFNSIIITNCSIESMNTLSVEGDT
jgi:hypothetical protein